MSLTLEKPKRIIDTKYTRWIKSQPCLFVAAHNTVGLNNFGPTDPHHVKAKGFGIMGSKVSDRRCIPLCRHHHEHVESSPNYYRKWFEAEIARLNRDYDAQFSAKLQRPKKERKVSPTVQHLWIRCECKKVHRIPSSKTSIVTFSGGSGIRYFCPFLKVYKNAGFRRGA